MSFDYDKLISQIKNLELPKEQEVNQICQKAKEIFLKESNLLHLSSPITICGDIHGQFDDLLELFEVGGKPPETNYLFLGDFVDRGFNSVETILLFLLFKIKYEDRIFLLRGNHECQQITQTYGFYDECKRKYHESINVWKYCCQVFDAMPLAALVNNKFFCVHGGLTPNIEKIEDIEKIDRVQEISQNITMSDLLWSDPDIEVEGFGVSPRGAGYIFGQSVVDKFVNDNNIDLIVRAHQLVMEGYKFLFGDKLVTVWSAPNYCYRCGNVASIMECDEDLEKEFKIFEAAPTDLRIQPTKKDIPEYFL